MYKISIYIEGRAGYFQYVVPTKDQAMAHFGEITAKGYRRINDREQLEWYSPMMIRYIKVEGKELNTQYPDTFIRT